MHNSQQTIRRRLLAVLLPAIAFLSVALATITYDRLYEAILNRFEVKLITVSALVGAFVDPVRHDALISATKEPSFEGPVVERTGDYVSEIEPMRGVRRKLSLTYLYTQVLGGNEDIFYVLDATEGPEHTTVGYADTMPANTLAGLRDVSAKGAIYVSPIELQEDWGLLKTAAAPVWGLRGTISSSAGADVNIGVIREYTENALLLSGVIGAFCLIIGSLAASAVVLRVAGPIAVVRSNALRLAAGRLSLLPLGSTANEITGLGRSLERVAADIATVERGTTERLDRLEEDRAISTLSLALMTGSHNAAEDEARPLAIKIIDLRLHTIVGFCNSTDVLERAVWHMGLACLDPMLSTDQVRDVLVLQGGKFLMFSKKSSQGEAVGGTIWLSESPAAEPMLLKPGEARVLESRIYNIKYAVDDTNFGGQEAVVALTSECAL